MLGFLEEQSKKIMTEIKNAQENVLNECGFPCEGMKAKVEVDGTEKFYINNELVAYFGPIEVKSVNTGKELEYIVSRKCWSQSIEEKRKEQLRLDILDQRPEFDKKPC